MPKASKKSIQEIYEENQLRNSPLKQPETWLWLHDIRSAHNVGSAFRSADAFGVSGIILSGFSPKPPKPEVCKTALGAENSVKWLFLEQPSEIATHFPKQQYQYLGIEQTHGSIPLQHFKPNKQKGRILLFGNEVRGLDEHLMPLMDDYLEIPQYGIKHSLNISVAVGICLYAFLTKSF